MIQKSNTQNLTKLKISNEKKKYKKKLFMWQNSECEKTQKHKCDKTQKTKNVTTFKNLKCERTQNSEFYIPKQLKCDKTKN